MPPPLTAYCGGCGTPLEWFPERCGTCGAQILPPPNVRMAEADRRRLRGAYYRARSSCTHKNILLQLEDLVTRDGRIVVNMRFTILVQLLTSAHLLYENFWADFEGERVVGREPAKTGERMAVDGLLFGHLARNVRFGTLSCEGDGPSFYGRYAVTLKDEAVRDRTSLLEDNAFKHRDKPRRISRLYRATWDDRHRMAAVKHATSLTPRSNIADTIRPKGTRTDDQDFIEAHIWRGFTCAAFSEVQVSSAAVSAAETADDKRIEKLCNDRSITFKT